MQPAEVQGSGADRGDPRGSWQVAHEALVALARKRAGLDLEEGRWLLRALRGQAHTRLGYGSFTEYVERWFGYVPRLTREKLRVAEALEHLPRLAAALEAGKLSFSVARELTRVATPDTERAWLDAVRGSTVRQVETLVSGQRPGSLPGDPPDASAVRHVLRFEVTADVLATFREAMNKIRREAGESLDDDAALLLLARHVLGGSRDEGRSSYQCSRSLRELSASTAAWSERRSPSRRRRDGPLRRSAHRISETDPRAPRGSRPSVHQSASRACPAKRLTRRPPRGPASRRRHLHRAGCTHRTFVDIHHLDPSADGGGNHPENLITLCSAHHRAHHRGALLIDGTPATGLRFSHADGTAYGGAPSPRIAERRAKACQALQPMGVRETAVKRTLARIPIRLEGGLAELIREALTELSAPLNPSRLAG